MIKAIVTDIEGTTSSLSFVKDVLFPYARTHLPAFVRQHQDESEVASLLEDARREAGSALDIEALIAQFIDWIDRDQKITPLKSLQGLIWEAGYRQGDFNGHIYEDAARCLKSWKEQGYVLFVYSSGSVYAQKLLFGHTEHGDLTPLFSGYFDTHIGGKREAESYRRIAEQIQYRPEEILFLSDIREELDAARQAGLNTYWLVREQAVDSQAAHRQTVDFDGIAL
ncbi:MAG: acireductone synthase [Methylococcaceae bacterium]|nr:acireductone synthase [Methylococcaceae bacterium]